jgi:hypothetical protein
MSKIRITFTDDSPIGCESPATVELEGDGGFQHWRTAINGAMTLAGYQPETIADVLGEDLIDPCCMHDGCDRCTPLDELDLEEPSVLGAGIMPLPSAPKLEDHVHPDKVVEKLHGEAIAG